ncbi:hypothetical protein KC19_11G080600 [Ceratodon purpureus]|uniref:Uncharacterized protein n=1 Tax=Ceratodon purpureus TaxID=3225 RepID=A0A8T0GE83_CERPU|nr:hypothetical protein KC19_11G080600 [Ceratodon purpureus]
MGLSEDWVGLDFAQWITPLEDMPNFLDRYVRLLERNTFVYAIGDLQVQAIRIGESIRGIIRQQLTLSRGLGPLGGAGMQDILKMFKIQVKSNLRYLDFRSLLASLIASDIVKYHSEGYPVDSLRARITSIEGFLSSELSTIIEEIFTMLEENITLFEDLYTIFDVENIDTQGPTEHYSVAYAVVVSAVVLLCLVYQYLIGYVDRGGSKADSSGSLEFRDTYISIVLFLGSYIWIKSRDVAPIPESAIRKCDKLRSKDGGITVKYEPRFKPRKENNVDIDRLYLGLFRTRIEAEVVYRTAASCYEYSEDYGSQVDLGDGRSFTIPPLSEDERGLSGKEKVDMVKTRAKRVHKAFIEVWNPPSTLTGAGMSQQLLLPSIQVGEGNALLQVPGHETQNLETMHDISMQAFPAQRINMQTPQLPCQDFTHVSQRIVEELTRQNLLQRQEQVVQRQEQVVQRQEQVVQRQEQVVQRQEQLVQRQEELVQRQELQLQQQTRKLKIDGALRTRRGSTCKKSGTQGSARKFSGLPQLLVPGPSASVSNLQLEDQNPESTHLQQRNKEPMPPSFRPDGVLESTDLEPHPEEDQNPVNQEFPRPEQDQNPESTHLQQRNNELMSPTHALQWWEGLP